MRDVPPSCRPTPANQQFAACQRKTHCYISSDFSVSDVHGAVALTHFSRTLNNKNNNNDNDNHDHNHNHNKNDNINNNDNNSN
jgi:hypothetical protein